MKWTPALALGLGLSLASVAQAQNQPRPTKPGPVRGGQPAKKAKRGFSGTITGEVVGDATKGSKKEAVDPAKAKLEAAKKAKLDAKAKAEAEKAKRLKMIKSIRFDRRPSVILETWAGPLDVPEKPKEPGGKPKKKPDPFAEALAGWHKAVVLGQWDAAESFIKGLDAKEEAPAAYLHMLSELAKPNLRPKVRRLPTQARAFAEDTVLSIDDLVAIIDMSPNELKKDALIKLGALLRHSLDNGHAIESFLKKARKDLTGPKQAFADTRKLARMLIAAKEAVRAGDFLPSIDAAIKNDDHQALNLLAEHLIARHAEDDKGVHLEQAWRALQGIFASRKIARKQRSEALKQAVALAPKIDVKLGRKWLIESFTRHPERGMEILSVIGSAAARSIEENPKDMKGRQRGLELQSIAVNALLKAAPKLAQKWRPALGLLAANWWNEANLSYLYDTSTGSGPQMQRDAWGNVFYMNMNRFRRPAGNKLVAVPVNKLLEIRPTPQHLELIDQSARPHFSRLYARLLLKAGEEEQAFPYIEELAKSHPERAKDLVEEFLRVWARNHNPNASRGRTRYFYMYGFQARAEGIPLTRSKQQRNLKELAHWVQRLQALKLGELDESLLTNAFTNCHSQAEVYRLKSIEMVFGKLEQLKPKTLAALIGKMRTNLVGVWRQPAVQKRNKTRRKQKDIRAEVMRGYQVARSVASKALAKHPKSWRLQLAKAAILHDYNNYQSELKASVNFAENLKQSFKEFQSAAALYAEVAPTLTKDDQSAEVYETWFTASLGAVDLRGIDSRKHPDLRQAKLIRQAIDKLPEKLRDHHLSLFAGRLFSRMGAARPEIKFRYLRSGFEIAGDHKQAAEARKVLDYYNDLVNEIKLEAAIDGSDVVGHKQAFGLFVNIKHTREIERESGGFGRYLQNQNSGRFFYYNFGRPLENYRDKFEDAARQALSEHFEVLSITFQSEKVNSKALAQYGWRVTPYAYLLLKPRGPEVDKLPSLRLDLDFIDTSGYVVLPIESPQVPIDASKEIGEPRPYKKAEVTQILDERQAKEGKLIVEVKATARGLVPDWRQLLEFNPKDFKVTSVDDQGLSVSKFDEESADTVVVSERSWLINLEAREGLAEFPKTFQFATPRKDGLKVNYQRYVDEDLLSVNEQISLEEQYGDPGSWALLWVVLAMFLLFTVAVFAFAQDPDSYQRSESGPGMPEQLTPFTVMTLLQSIRDSNGLNPDQKSDLNSELKQLERFYFMEQGGEAPNLEALARRWLEASKN